MRTHKNNKENERKSAADSEHFNQEGVRTFKPPTHWNGVKVPCLGGSAMPPQRKRQEDNVREEVGTIKEGQNEQITQTPDFDSGKGESIEKQGRISSPAKNFDLVQSTGVRIRQKPSGNSEELGRLKYNSPILVRALDQTGEWAFVIANDGKAGWLDKSYTAHPQPEPNAKLYHVKEGMAAQKDILFHYKNQGYSPEIGFDDKDIYKAVTIANQGRKGAGIDLQKYEESKNSWGNRLKNLVDGQGDKRATYQAIRFTAGTNIWLPSLAHVKQLRENGVISKRSDWLDTGIAAGKGVTAFSDGLVSGFLGGIWDALSGLWDLGGEIISLVGKIATGEILGDIQNIFKFFKDLSPEKAKEIVSALLSTITKAFGDFKTNWNNGNFYDKWQFRGKVAGNILLEVVLAIFTGGMGNAAKWLGKLGKVAPKLVAVFQKVVNKVEKALPDNFKHDKRKDSDAADGKDFDKEQALLLAKMITEGHDKKDSPISVLKANLAIVKQKYPVVKRFDFESVADNRYKVWMIASKKLVDGDYTPEEKTNFTVKESQILAEITDLYNSSEFRQLRKAHADGRTKKINFNGIEIQYQHDFTYAEAFNNGKIGWTMGPKAFKSELELKKTLLHERYRNIFDKKTALSAEDATKATQNTFNFAEKAEKYIK